MFPPPKLKILSDQNELELIDTITPKPKGQLTYIYKYSKSLTKKGTLLGLTEPELRKIQEENKPL